MTGWEQAAVVFTIFVGVLAAAPFLGVWFVKYCAWAYKTFHRWLR